MQNKDSDVIVLNGNGKEKSASREFIFPGKVFLSNNIGEEPTPFDEARDMATAFCDKWNQLKFHLARTGGAITFPNSNQSIAFRIDKAELINVFRNTQYAAIIYCINPNSRADPKDDALSLIFAGLNDDKHAINDVAAEKWPGIFTHHQVTGRRMTLAASAYSLISLFPDHFRDKARAVDLISNFVSIWGALVSDTSGTILSNRPTIQLEDHPLAFLLSSSVMHAFLNTPTLEVIIGILGYDLQNHQILPILVGADNAGNPVGNFLFIDDIEYTVNGLPDVRTEIFQDLS